LDDHERDKYDTERCPRKLNLSTRSEELMNELTALPELLRIIENILRENEGNWKPHNRPADIKVITQDEVSIYYQESF
jgi:hypothetical protein